MKMHLSAVLIVALLVTAALGAWGEQCAKPVACKSCPAGKEIKLWGGMDSKPKIAEAYKPEKTTIGIGRFDLFEITGAAAGYTLAEREVVIYNRLNEILSYGPPDGVCLRRVRSAPTIYVGPYRLVSVYKQDAVAAGLTQDELAAKWCQTLAAALPNIVTANAAPKSPLLGSYEVAVGGTFLLRLRDKAEFPSIKARGAAVDDRVTAMLSDGRKGRLAVRATQTNGQWAVCYGELELVKVTARDATLNCSTPQLLAQRWAADLNAALAKLKSSTGDGNNPQ